MSKTKAIFITRCDIGWYSKNANVYRKTLEVATKYNATLYVPEHCRVPSEIAEKCCEIVRFCKVRDVLAQRCRSAEGMSDVKVFTGFDFPCMYVGWRLKKKYGCHWTIFLWDPPSLSHRDRFLPLRWIIDFVFRFFARRCDRLVLNIHPGLLDEIGYRPHEGQLELRMQDAWEGVSFNHVEQVEHIGGFDYDFGVLSNWSKAKGGELVAAAMRRMSGKKCLWIGDPPKDANNHEGIEFIGKLPQDEAFKQLRRCHFLVIPYLPVPSLKWNYPLKMFEYLDIGHPIIASDNHGNAVIAQKYPHKIKLFHGGSVDDFIRVVEGRPLFSCVIPVKGNRRFIDQALESLRSQGMGDDLEIIIQNGDIEPDNGQSDAINKGFSKAKGAWLFWLNSDDILLPRALEVVRECILSKPKARWVGGNVVYMNAERRVISVDRSLRPPTNVVRKFPTWVGGPSSFFKRKLWDEQGGCDEKLHYVMDIDLWTRWSKSGEKFYNINKFIWGFRVHNDSLTTGGKYVSEKHEEFLALLKQHGMRHYKIWKRLIQIGRIVNGSIPMRFMCSHQMRGKIV